MKEMKWKKIRKLAKPPLRHHPDLMPLPPPEGFAPPPPAGFSPPDFPVPEETQTTETAPSIDHEAARRMLLGLEDEEENEDSTQEEETDDSEDNETQQDDHEPEGDEEENEENQLENIDVGAEEEPEQEEVPPPPPIGFDAPPPPPGFAEEEPEKVIDDFSSIDSLADSLSLLDDDFESEVENNIPEETPSFEIQGQPEQTLWPVVDEDSESPSEVSQAIEAFGLVKESEFELSESEKTSRPSPFL